MLVTYFRSSSYTAWDFCQFKYMLDYTLGFRSPANKKAELGSITHKALELLARKKLAMQNGEKHFRDEEMSKEWPIVGFTPDQAVDAAWNYYTKEKDSLYEWDPADLRRIRRLTEEVLTYNDGQYNPLKRKVVVPEQYFDFTIDEPWAKYAFTLPNGQKIEGQLALKGTVDLVCEVDGFPGILELVDWKTGKRLDWATGEKKEWKKLRVDPQLRIYHYALSRLFPQAKEIFVTIFWIADGGPYSLPFCREDLAETEKMIRKRFEEVRSITRPKQSRTWKCDSFCHYGTNKHESGKTLCNHYHGELMQLGLDKMMKKHAKGDVTQYGDGGGRSGEKTGR